MFINKPQAPQDYSSPHQPTYPGLNRLQHPMVKAAAIYICGEMAERVARQTVPSLVPPIIVAKWVGVVHQLRQFALSSTSSNAPSLRPAANVKTTREQSTQTTPNLDEVVQNITSTCALYGIRPNSATSSIQAQLQTTSSAPDLEQPQTRPSTPTPTEQATPAPEQPQAQPSIPTPTQQAPADSAVEQTSPAPEQPQARPSTPTQQTSADRAVEQAQNENKVKRPVTIEDLASTLSIEEKDRMVRQYTYKQMAQILHNILTLYNHNIKSLIGMCPEEFFKEINLTIKSNEDAE